MAGIGTSQPPKLAEYDVFLSFRGKDTRKTFTSCLYHDLVSAGIRVLRDEEELSKGKYIGSELLRAIENSRICMPILSPNFATSAWCLREVAHMVQCMQKSGGALEISPILYNMEVSNVKLREGSTYEVHINKHKGDRFKEEDLLQWKDALKEVAKIKFWSMNDDSDHGELIKSIVHDILIKLSIKHRNLPRKFVERQHQVDDLMKSIDVDSEGVRFIVIHGMGGIGKTTLANVVFNLLYSHYEGRSFLESVREGAKRHGHSYLQQKLLSDILNHHFTKVFSDINDGITNIKGRLCTKKVLIVIDDVDEIDQLKILAGESCWFGSGTRIIVTTRDLQVLPMQEGVNKYYIHKLEQMEFNDALCLFSWHAFGKDYPPDKYYDDLSKEIVTATGCLPLALEVIGASLFHHCLNSSEFECKKIWEETLKELSIPNKKVEDMLMISIKKLDSNQMKIFLDIASALINEDKTNAMYMWDDCGFSPFNNIAILSQMSLVKDTNSNKLWMHDTLRDLGRQLIIRKESLDNIGRHSRVWNEKQAKEIINKKQAIMKYIEVLPQNLDERSLPPVAFKKFENVRFLKVQGKFNHSISAVLKWSLRSKVHFKKILPELRWLWWHHLPSDCKGINFYLSNLVVLELCNSSISEDWKGWMHFKAANKLKVLDLTGCKQLKRTPCFSSFLLLERLVLKNCERLVEIDPSIGKLGKLIYLNMKGCSSLGGLPEEIGHLTSLTTIIMGGSGQQFHLPSSMGDLRSLTSFEMGKVSIFGLPESIGGLISLKRLSLKECTILQKLPDSIGNLESLVELDLSGTEGISELPGSIGNLKSLKVINVSETSITRLPAMIGLLKSLKALHAIRCQNLSGEIPSSIKNLSHLGEFHMQLAKATKMECLPELPSSLNTLTIEASGMEITPDLSYLSNLTDLTLEIGGSQHTNLRWICKLSKLNKLSITHSYVTTLGEEFASLIRLERLFLRCPNLKCPLKLPSGLRTLHIDPLSLELQTLPNEGISLDVAIPCLGELQMLRHLSLHLCNFSNLNGFHLLRNLKKLFIGGTSEDSLICPS